MNMIRNSRNYQAALTVFVVCLFALEHFQLTNVHLLSVLLLGFIMLSIMAFFRNNVVSRIFGVMIGFFFLYAAIVNISSFSIAVLIDAIIGIVLVGAFGYQLYAQYKNSDIWEEKVER